MELSIQILTASFQVVLAALGIQLLYWGLNHFLYRRFTPDQQISCKYSTMVTNASYVGIPIDPLVRNVCVLLSAMPAPTTTVILAQKYGRNPSFATKLLVISTLLSMITIPIITTLLDIL